ncbi:MAG: hypothetical protein F9K29_19350 [Hyphomicrobiaceae bacterium]|nr:MAG: hypothetical protein F9K29_19350 [Hyphomicrobiaceae bacterium]
MRKITRGLFFLVLASVLGPAVSVAEEVTPAFWAVTGVRAGDVLHLRDVPSAESKSLAGIPPDARGLKNLGCRTNVVPLEQWARMTKAQRDYAQTRWCRVEYRGQQGWVAQRYLKQDSALTR